MPPPGLRHFSLGLKATFFFGVIQAFRSLLYFAS